MGKFLELFNEGAQLDRGISMLKNAGKENMIEDFVNLTKSYKSGKYLPTLVKFYLEDGGPSFDIIKDYYQRYVKTPKLRDQKLGIEKYKNFQHFEKEVDSVAGSATDEEMKDISDDPIYEDENVKIYRGMSKPECRKYGQGAKYGFCISRNDASNLYWGYRKNGATFYFVYFKKKSLIKSPIVDELIVIHAYPNDRFMINYSKPNRDFSKSKEEIISDTPALKKPFEQNIFKDIPLSEKEQKIINYIDRTDDITELKSIEDQLIWIELGKRIKDGYVGNFKIWKKYIEVGSHDLSKYQKQTLKEQGWGKLLNRYNEKIKQRFEIKESEGLLNYITNDEALYSLKSGYLDKYFKEKIYQEKDLPPYYVRIMDEDIFHAYAERVFDNWAKSLLEIKEESYQI